ncbi:MAG: hypothetical protein H6706_20400 [Myxococcales bacterium]|nr:hypothetical protein [Myxococcales bacterium]
MPRTLPLVIALIAAVGLLGCDKLDPNSPAAWIEKLKTPERTAAIAKLGEMKAKEAIGPLMEAYKEGRDKYEIIAALTQIGDKAAVPTLLEALQDTSAGKAGQLAATTLREWEVKEHSDVYINVASNKTATNEQRYGALQLLAEYPVPKAEQPLLTILNGDPDLQPIAFNGLAAEALGKLKSAQAVPGLIACLWLDDHLHRNEVPKCRLALNRVGAAAAVPELIKTLERKNRQVEDRAKKYKFHIGGLIEAKTAELLGDMPSVDAVEPLIAALKKNEEMPVSVQNDPKKAQIFVMGGVQRVISVSNALAVIGDERAIEPLLEVAGNPELALEHKLSATQQLAFLGNPKAIDGTKATPGLMALLEKKINKQDPVSQGFRVQIALSIANLLDGTDEKTMAAFEKSVAAIQAEIQGWIAEDEKAGADKRDIAAYKEWGKSYDEAMAKIAAVKECTTDPTCWGKKLAPEEKNIAVRLVAAYRLAQLKDARDTAVKALLANIGDTDLVVRNVILFGLDRLADASAIPDLEKAKTADEELAKKDKRYQGAAYTTELMIAKLSHKPKG